MSAFDDYRDLVGHRDQLLVENDALQARVAELESRLAEIEAQEPVGVALIGEDMSCEFIPHSNKLMLAGDYQLYTRPVAPQPVKEDTK